MPSASSAVIVANMIGSALAVVCNIALSLVGPRELRRLGTVVATLALAYVAGYWYLLLNPDDVANWSYVMRAVSLLAWPIAWCAPAVVMIRIAIHLRATQRRLERELTGLCDVHPIRPRRHRAA